MKQLLLTITLVLSIPSFSQTQAEMNNEAYKDFNESDKLLNKTYQKILKVYKSDTLFIQNLRKSQRIWIQFRDAEIDMKYPDYDGVYYGSFQPVCRAQYLKELTDDRIKTLQQWLNGVEEGDICSGSVNTM